MESELNETLQEMLRALARNVFNVLQHCLMLTSVLMHQFGRLARDYRKQMSALSDGLVTNKNYHPDNFHSSTLP
jgi:hypothetical protein